LLCRGEKRIGGRESRNKRDHYSYPNRTEGKAAKKGGVKENTEEGEKTLEDNDLRMLKMGRSGEVTFSKSQKTQKYTTPKRGEKRRSEKEGPSGVEG